MVPVVAVLNANGDSLPDIYMTGNLVPDKLFINEGHLHFKDATAESGILTKNKRLVDGVPSLTSTMTATMTYNVCRSRWKDSLAHPSLCE
jgi:hypothetical protein